MDNLINKILKLNKKPPVFEITNNLFWNDDYISKQMLKAHLDPFIDAASRKKETIIENVKFLSSFFSINENDAILDLGCGPGLYCREFNHYSKRITGIDISKNSIEYAKADAINNNQLINYICGNYVSFNFKDRYNFVFLIYFDFCALNPKNQSTLLSKIYDILDDDGYFIFDVTLENYPIDISDEWYTENNGFWKPNRHLVLKKTFLYKTLNTYLNQYTIVDENGIIDVYRIYHQFYSLERIKKLLKKHNFEIIYYWTNLNGVPYKKNEKTLALAVQKKKIC